MSRQFVGLMIVGGLVLSAIGACHADDGPATQPANSPATQPDGSRTEASMQSSVLAAGTPAPLFDLPSNRGQQISLADFAGKQIVVLYFYPKADTPGCTKEACGFRDALADSDHSVARKYGVWQGKLKRTTFVIAKDGTILHVFQNVKPQGHDQEVLAWLKANAL